MSKKILLISWHFPPYKSSSAFNLFKRIKDTGYDYDVLQVKRSVTPTNEGMFRYGESRFSRYEIDVLSEDARDPEARSRFVEQTSTLYTALKSHNHYALMLSHSHEIASHLAAIAIKKQAPNLKWIASFGDPIAANPYNSVYKFPLLEQDSAIETEVLNLADRIIVTNSYQADIMNRGQREPVDDNKFFIVPHCYDRRMFPSTNSSLSPHNREISVFTFRHIGMLYKHKRTSEPFLLAAERLVQTHPHLKNKFKIEFYGAKDRYIDAVSSYGLDGIISYEGNLPYLDSLAVMETADCLLLRDADFTDQNLIATPFYPGKLADYLGARKPIIAVTMNQGFVPDLLSSLGGAFFKEDNVDGIADAMHSAILGDISFEWDKVNDYSHERVAAIARRALTFPDAKKTLLIAGHDLKFARHIISEAERRKNIDILVDQWRGHDVHDEKESRELLDKSDYIMCEWGLGNAVWYSKNKKSGQRLITRLHLQEYHTNHPRQFKHEAIDAYIMVSPYWYEKFLDRFSFDRKKSYMVFNLVDVKALDLPKEPDAQFHLGMIGDVPQRKRLDRALDLFGKLVEIDTRYKLFIKGKRPEEYLWMRSPERSAEMDYYYEQYKRIKENGWEDSVVFDEYGPIEKWFQKIGYILSVSDFESFHLAPAEGMASGAVPVFYAWPGCETIYPEDYIIDFEDMDGLHEFLQSARGNARFLKRFSEERFDHEKNASIILDIITGDFAETPTSNDCGDSVG